MRIVELYSHLNGWEYLLVRKRQIARELKQVIASVDAEACRTKVSKEARKKKLGNLYSPIDMNGQFRTKLKALGWDEDRVSYWVTSDVDLIARTMGLAARDQKQEIIAAGKTPIGSYNQTDFSKDRVHVEVQFGKYSFVAYDLFVKHMAFFVSRKIDVGIEILPMKSLAERMSSGVPYYEGSLYDLIRQGRSTPAVPLVLIGIAP